VRRHTDIPATAADPPPADLSPLRKRMVEADLRGRGICNLQVLEVMARVPREEFVPQFVRELAYEDRAQAIGYDQTISQPYIVALMTEALQLQGTEKVLEVGTGSGYQTAILAELCAHVYSIERIPELSLRASMVLDRLGYRNVELRVGDGTLGWTEAAPFDAILVAAAAPALPKAYHAQLKEGGRLVIPLGTAGDQVLHRFTRHGSAYEDEVLSRVSFVPLIADPR